MRGYPVQTKINVAIAGVGNRARAICRVSTAIAEALHLMVLAGSATQDT